MNACKACGWIDNGQGWGEITHDGDSFLQHVYPCVHINGMRRCDSCSTDWYRVGNDNTWDADCVGDPPRHVASCASEDCPDCIAFEGESESADLETKLDAALGAKVAS